MREANAIEHSIRWHSRWLGIGLAFAWGIALLGGLLSTFDRDPPDWIGLAGGAPLILIAGYGVLCLGFSTERIRIAPAGIEVRGDPFRGGAIGRQLAPSDIANCYYRYARYSAKSGIDPHWAAGVTTIRGTWVDLIAPLPTRDQAQETASRIAEILNKPAPAEIAGWPPRDPKLAWRVAAWGGAFILALLWLAGVETLRAGM